MTGLMALSNDMLLIKSTVMTELSVSDKQKGPERKRETGRERERERERESEGETSIVSQSEILCSTGWLSGKKTLLLSLVLEAFFLLYSKNIYLGCINLCISLKKMHASNFKTATWSMEPSSCKIQIS